MEEIRHSYLRLSLLLHPDKHPKQQGEAEEAFSKLQNAFHILSDPSLRRVYDRYGERGIKELMQIESFSRETFNDASSLEALLDRNALEGIWGKVMWIGPRLKTSFDISSGFLKYGAMVGEVEISEDLLLIGNPLLPFADIRLSSSLKVEGGSGSSQFGIYFQLKNFSPFKRWFSEEPKFTLGVSSVGSGGDNKEGLLSWEQQITPSLSMSTSLQFPISNGEYYAPFPNISLNYNHYLLNINPQQQCLGVVKQINEYLSTKFILKGRSFGFKGIDASMKIITHISQLDYISFELGNDKDQMISSFEYCHVWNVSPVTMKEACSTIIGFDCSPDGGVGMVIGIKFINNSQIKIPIKMGEEMDFETISLSIIQGILGCLAWNYLFLMPLRVLSKIKREGSFINEPSLEVQAKKRMMIEEEKNGLIIRKALYCGERDVKNSLMAQCIDSSLQLGPMSTFSRIPGFNGGGGGADNQCYQANNTDLYIEYTFRGILHSTTIKDGSLILLPLRKDICQ